MEKPQNIHFSAVFVRKTWPKFFKLFNLYEKIKKIKKKFKRWKFQNVQLGCHKIHPVRRDFEAISKSHKRARHEKDPEKFDDPDKPTAVNESKLNFVNNKLNLTEKF